MVSEDVLILTNDGYYRQVDGVAMGSAVGPLLTNIFVAKFESSFPLSLNCNFDILKISFGQ